MDIVLTVKILNYEYVLLSMSGDGRPGGTMRGVSEHAKRCKAPTKIEGEIGSHSQVLCNGAGCDGRMKSRDYYTEFAEKLPKDTIILTAGCAKYRYNKLPLGDIGGIPVYWMPDS